MASMVSEALIELALRPQGRAQVGLIVDRTPERIVELRPSHPIPGPNQVAVVRCAPERVAAVVAEADALAAAHGLACLWILDPDARPVDLPDRLSASGLRPTGETAVMVLPASAELTPGDAAIEIVDALRDLATFAAAEAVQAAGFGGAPAPREDARFADARADPGRRCLLALVGGEPAGMAWATVHEDGVLLNGGTVAPPFQRRGVYRALLAARLALARHAGVAGIGVQARPDTAAPILARLGFTEVGRWRLFGRDRA
jgi:GNAT superfamily N-acetyltransferase